MFSRRSHRPLVCASSRKLAFAPIPAPVNAASSKSATRGEVPPLNYPPPLPISAMPPAERVLQVFVATTSNLINGAVFGGLFGFVSGLWSTRSFRGAATEARSNGRSWASISAVYAGLQTAAKMVRGKDDRYNALVGACGSGAVFTANGGPAAAAQGCVSFAALSYVIDMLTAPRSEPQTDEEILNKPSRR